MSARIAATLRRAQVSPSVLRRFYSAKNEQKFDLKDGSFKLWVPRGTEGFTGPNNFAMSTKEECEQMFSLMVLIRNVERVSDQHYKMRHIRGFCHLYSGQEAVVTGMEFGANRDDPVITAYRDHGNQLVRGDTTKSVMAELFGKYAGCSKGKGGSMHMYYRKNNFFGGNGIVGAQVPVGAGLAYALKYNKEKATNCSFIMYGDGASNQGQVFEAYNMAKLWDLPAVFICENNLYGMGTSSARSSANTEYYTRGDLIPGIKIDAMNVFAVKEGIRYAKEWATTKGPIVLEMSTYRYHGHSMSDPGTTYRNKDEIAQVRDTRDPIENMRKQLLESGMFTEAYLKDIEKKIRKEVEAETNEALAGPEPPAEELYKDVYAGDCFPIRGAEATTVYLK